MLNSRHLSSLAALTFIGLTGVTGAAIAAGPSSQFDLNGDVVTPGVYNLCEPVGVACDDRDRRPIRRAEARSRTPTPGRGFGRCLGSAGGSSRSRGSRTAAFSTMSWLSAATATKRFSRAASSTRCSAAALRRRILVAYSDTGGQLGPGGADGFARMVVPGDTAGGRYVSNLVDLTVGQAPVPAKGPGGAVDPIHAERRSRIRRTYALSSLAGPARRAAHSDLQGRRDAGHGHLHRRFLVDAAQ